MMTAFKTATDLPEPTKEQLLDYITPEWMCVMYSDDSLLSKVLADFELEDSDGTRSSLRAMLTELTREGRITCDNRPWKDRKGGNQHQSQCRRVT